MDMQNLNSKFEEKPIRALWWKEPYGTLMLHGKIETRTWSTNYRGLVLICCSKQPYYVDSIRKISGLIQLNRMVPFVPKTPPNGMAIAVGELIDCRPMTKDDEDACFVEYWNGLWCHVYKNVRPIEPFPLKGSQGWRKLDDEIISKIKFL